MDDSLWTGRGFMSSRAQGQTPLVRSGRDRNCGPDLGLDAGARSNAGALARGNVRIDADEDTGSRRGKGNVRAADCDVVDGGSGC